MTDAQTDCRSFFWQWDDKTILMERHNGDDFLITRPTAHELIDYVFRQHGTMGRPRPLSELDAAWMEELDAKAKESLRNIMESWARDDIMQSFHRRLA